LHGDHCLGLPGLISSLGLLGRTADLHIYAQADAEKVFQPVLNYFCKELPFNVFFNSFSPAKRELIFEDRTLKVFTIPLKHRVPSAGFLFEEKPKSPHIIREMIDFYQVPVSRIAAIKEGADFVTPEGETIANRIFTRPSELPHRYAYCMDTAYYEKIIPIIEGVDMLYHEATFSHEDLVRAKETYHSSARQAALIAQAAQVKKLVIAHFSARITNEKILLDEAREVFPNTVLANEGMVLKV
jgi:ribonuclease Z